MAYTLDVGAEAEFEAKMRRLYNAICRIGHAIAAADDIEELPDEWPNLVQDWLLAHRHEIVERGVTEAGRTQRLHGLENRVAL